MCVLRIVSLTIKKLRYAVHDAVYCRVLAEGGRQEPKTFVLGQPGTTSAMYHCLVYSVSDYTCFCLQCCWLGCMKGIRPVKTEWWGAGVVICLERVADLQTADATATHCLLLQ